MNRFKQIFSILVFLFIFLEFFHPISAFTQDLGRHLLLGKIILQTHAVPKTNLFSYTYPNFPFINTHWLSEVIFYLITQTLGLPGLLFVMSCVAALSVLLIVFMSFRGIAEKSHSKIFALILVTMVSSGILLERTDLRPEIFSFLFMSIFIVILWRHRNSVIARSSAKQNNEAISKNKIAALLSVSRNDKENSLISKIKHPTSTLFLLPILEILWVNMHIYFIIGPLLILVFLADTIIQNLWSFYREKNPNTKIRNPKQYQNTNDQKLKSFENLSIRKFEFVSIFDIRILKLFLVFVLTILATLLNPNGLAGALYPFTVFHNYGYTIEENQSIFFLLNYGIHNWSYLFFGIGVVGLFFLLLTNLKHARPIDWLLFVVFSYISASAIRNLPLFALATLPTIVYLLSNPLSSLSDQRESQGVPQIKSHSKNKGDTSSEKEILHYVQAMALETQAHRDDKPHSQNTKYTILHTKYILLGLIFCMGFMLYLFMSQNGLGYGITPGAEKGADFFLNNHLSGPLFNNFDIGSYLDYRLYPGTKVFVDGRPEAYPASFFQATYEPMQENPTIFQEVDQKYHFSTIFFSYTDQTPWAQEFIQAIMKNPNWNLVYLDTFSAIWTRNTNQLPTLQPTTYTIPPNQSLTQYLRLAYFFSLIKWQQPMISSLQKVVSLDPTNCQALGVLSQNPSTSMQYSQSYFDHCR